MKHIFVFILSVILITADAQNAKNNIVVGTIDSVYSRVLAENRKIWVYVPNSDPNSLYSKQKSV